MRYKFDYPARYLISVLNLFTVENHRSYNIEQSRKCYIIIYNTILNKIFFCNVYANCNIRYYILYNIYYTKHPIYNWPIQNIDTQYFRPVYVITCYKNYIRQLVRQKPSTRVNSSIHLLTAIFQHSKVLLYI